MDMRAMDGSRMKTIEDYRGWVLEIHSHYLYDDDRPFYTAMVYDADNDEIKSVSCEYSDRPDASAAVVAQAVKRHARVILEGLMGDAVREATDETRVGVEVVFIRTYKRKGAPIAAGTIGRVTWHGVSHAAYSEWSKRYTSRILLADGSIAWLADGCGAVAVYQPEDYLPSLADMTEDAERTAERIGATWGRRG